MIDYEETIERLEKWAETWKYLSCDRGYAKDIAIMASADIDEAITLLQQYREAIKTLNGDSKMKKSIEDEVIMLGGLDPAGNADMIKVCVHGRVQLCGECGDIKQLLLELLADDDIRLALAGVMNEDRAII
jgi:hypothetical protein